MIVDIFVTDMCNAHCPYCFVNKGNYQITKNEIDYIIQELSSKEVSIINILGGEPTLSQNVIPLINELLNKITHNIRLYSNGYDLEMLNYIRKLGVDVIINYDAYNNSLEYIKNYKWNYTIAPTTIDNIISVSDNFVLYGKELDFGMLRYRTNNSLFWTYDNLEKLDSGLCELYDWYEDKILTRHQSYLPLVLKRSLLQFIMLSKGMCMSRDCTNKISFVNGEKRMCYAVHNMCDINKKCLNCIYGTVCDFRRSCYAMYNDDIMCKVEEIMMRRAQEINHRLVHNPIWQRVIMSLYEGENGTNR